MDLRDALRGHLEHLRELGVAGISRDPAWRTRPDNVRSESPERPAGVDPPEELEPQDSVPTEPLAVSMFDATVPVRATQSPAEALRSIREELGDCTRCKLHGLGRRQIVFGVGNPNADLLFVGEAPGHDEDVQGIPFVGRAGQLLTKIIESIGLSRDDVYIANVIKCRPPENRNPEPDEVKSCQPFLFAQIDALQPKAIVALGSFAARVLLQTEVPISKLRGRLYEYRGAKLVATFHPAFLLRSPDRKRDVWEDMKKVRDLLKGGG